VRKRWCLTQSIWIVAVVILGLWWLPSGGAAEAGPLEEGVDLFQAGHYRWALEKFVEAVDQAPRDPQRRLYVAETYRQLGDGQAAAQAYRQIMQMAPGSTQANAARQALESLGEPARLVIQIPVQTRGTLVLVPARINGQALGYFILDTGATYITISRGVADTLRVRGGGGQVHLSTASGVIQAPLVLLDEVDVGGAVTRNVTAVVHDLPNAPPAIVGLLGLSFLERFRVSLDLTSRVLVLQSGDE
jgi:clan AA aspartic protease (TIGR02281 family)